MWWSNYVYPVISCLPSKANHHFLATLLIENISLGLSRKGRFINLSFLAVRPHSQSRILIIAHFLPMSELQLRNSVITIGKVSSGTPARVLLACMPCRD